MAGTLFVVATPIGHLDDITARALRVLGEVSLVAAEDTRRTGNLLRHFGLPTRILSLHEHNERSRAPALVARLQRGESIALVSDAGTPGISDPGSELVRAARLAGVRVEPIPGPSAVSAAISVAGLAGSSFIFLGFPPTRSKDRHLWFERVAAYHADTAIVFYEAPHRIRRTLESLVEYVKCPILVLRELTKVHEESLSGRPAEILARLQRPQGEFTVVIPTAEDTGEAAVPVSATTLKDEIGRMIESGASSRRAAARTVAHRFGLSTKFVYDATKD